MKKLLFLLGLLLCVMPKMIAQDKIVPMYRIGGHYFSKELPMDEAFKISSSIMALADKDGNRVVNLLVGDDFKVPESIKKYEIPFEKVLNGEQLEEGAQNFAKMKKLINSTDVEKFIVGKALPDDFSEKDIDGKTWTGRNERSCNGCKCVVFWLRTVPKGDANALNVERQIS